MYRGASEDDSSSGSFREQHWHPESHFAGEDHNVHIVCDVQLLFILFSCVNLLLSYLPTGHHWLLHARTDETRIQVYYRLIKLHFV